MNCRLSHQVVVGLPGYNAVWTALQPWRRQRHLQRRQIPIAQSCSVLTSGLHEPVFGNPGLLKDRLHLLTTVGHFVAAFVPLSYKFRTHAYFGS